MADSDAYLMCLPVKGHTVVVPGSTKEKCSACQTPVWVSRASLALRKQHNLRILCMKCAEERAEKDPDVRVQAPTPEQFKEIQDLIDRG